MKKKTLIILFALIAAAGTLYAFNSVNNKVHVIGEGNLVTHIEGTMDTDKWGDELIICESGTDLRINWEEQYLVKAKDGRFSCDVHTDYAKLYNVFFLKLYENGSWYMGSFLTESDTVSIKITEDRLSDGRDWLDMKITSNGVEGRNHEILESILQANY